MTFWQILICYAAFIFIDGSMLYFLWGIVAKYIPISPIGYFEALLVMLLYFIIKMRKTVTFKDGIRIGN